MMRVLVTGANGFVGRHTLVRLGADGYEVHAIDNRRPQNESFGVIWHQLDLFDHSAVTALLADLRPTHLLHFAWYTVPGCYWRSIENFRWLEASITLFRSFHECGGQRAVMAGTCAEYDWKYGFLCESVTPCKPVTPYGVCKNALQELLSAYSHEVGLSSAWGRIFFLYGPGEHPSRLVSSVVTSLLRGETARCSHGNQIRDFLHVEDVASAFVALLNSAVEGPVNIASGRPTALRDVVLAAADYLGSRDLVQFGAIPALGDDPPLLVGDNRRLSDEVGWNQRFELHAGIEQTVEWWKIQLYRGN